MAWRQAEPKTSFNHCNRPERSGIRARHASLFQENISCQLPCERTGFTGERSSFCNLENNHGISLNAQYTKNHERNGLMHFLNTKRKFMQSIQTIPGYQINEYMLVLNPHEDLRNKIIQIRKEFNETYKSQSLLGTKPNLALVRFTQ